MFDRFRPLSLPFALSVGAALLASCTPTKLLATDLKLEPEGADKIAPGFFPVPIALSAEKPAGVTKEPAYRAKPRYGTVNLGGDAGKTYAIALDEPASGTWKIYLDANHNGDLTDDGDGAWSNVRSRDDQTIYGPNSYVLDVSWKLAGGKEAEGKYGLAFLRTSKSNALLMLRQGHRTGTLELNGKPHQVSLLENDGDAVFHKPVATTEEAKQGRPVWLLVDLNDDGRFDPESDEVVDIRGPFKLAGQTYESIVSPDGASLKLKSSHKEALDLTVQSEDSPMLPVGSDAPNFKVLSPEGKPIELAQYRGKVVVLDFWSTWCGPCQLSMPHVEEVYQRVQGKPVEVLAVCVFDEQKNFAEWIPKNQKNYHFQFAFDPGGRDDAKSVAASLYGVSSIPATFVIDQNGKVAASISGFSDEDRRIEEALRKLGVM